MEIAVRCEELRAQGHVHAHVPLLDLVDLRVVAEAQRDQLARGELVHAMLDVLADRVGQAHGLLEGDDAVLNAQRHAARGPGQQRQREGEDHFPPHHARAGVAERVNDAHHDVQQDQRQDDEVIERVVTAMRGVRLRLGHGTPSQKT